MISLCSLNNHQQVQSGMRAGLRGTYQKFKTISLEVNFKSLIIYIWWTVRHYSSIGQMEGWDAVLIYRG